jgi:hypothetical protein
MGRKLENIIIKVHELVKFKRVEIKRWLYRDVSHYTGLFEMFVGVLTTCHTHLRYEYMYLFI